MKLGSLLLVLLATTLGFANDAPEDKPNVLVILTDDQGWGDLSVHGNSNLATPNLDGLAHAGVSFENFYVCQVCAPTRAEFLTGRYYPKTGVSGVSRGQGRLNPDETTVADLFKANGYVTGAFGKWHNGTQPPYHPNYRGFDEYYGFTSGHWGYYFSPPLDHNGKRVRGDGFVVDDFTNHAIKFIEDNQNKPFFCYVPLNTPHSPMMVDDRFYDKFDGVDPEMKHRDPKREDVMMTRAALALCENIDWNVGRILKRLEELHLAENTIVVFFCDNGPNSYRWNGGMKGRKGAIDEGGLRSPLFIRWPQRIESEKNEKTITGAIDLLPTLTEMCGLETQTAKPIDGRSLWPLIARSAEGVEATEWASRHLFSIKKNQVSVRTQKFRLDSEGKLFDIEADRGQTRDVADDHPKLAKQLRAEAAKHAQEMQGYFDRYADRPFTVGFAGSTTLPARDGIEQGTIKRSAKPPNNSFFTNWTSVDDSITWNVEVVNAGEYEVVVHYTCAVGDEGATMQLAMEGGGKVAGKIEVAFDPPLYDKSKERVAKSHYYQKDFKPASLGTISLDKTSGTLTLRALDIVGEKAIDVHSIDLIRR